jgi:hypothetical protein
MFRLFAFIKDHKFFYERLLKAVKTIMLKIEKYSLQNYVKSVSYIYKYM